MVPWLEKDEQDIAFPPGIRFENPDEQREYVKKWLIEDAQLPFFIEWVSKNHPSTDGAPVAKISKIEMSGDENKISDWINQPSSKVAEGIEIIWRKAQEKDDETGILSVEFKFQSNTVSIF
jgi:hypothetical protein